MAPVDRRLDESPRPGQQLVRAQAPDAGVALHRGHQRFGSHEYLAAKQVMQKLAQNGGKVPDELKH